MNNQQIFSEIIVQILGFGIVFWVLRQFAFGPLLGIIEKRKSSIEQTFARLEAKQAELGKLEADYRQRLEHIEQEARVKIQEAASEGLRVSRQMQEKARQDAQAMLERAKADIEQEIAKARVSLRDQIVELSSKLTEKVLRQKLGPADQKKLVDQFVKDFEEMP
ncbi:MAG: F0F1 ATP synthase subunit B [Candidatus Omnitrophota bacterium]